MRSIFILLFLFGSLVAGAAEETNCEKGFSHLSKIKMSKKPWNDFFDYFTKYVPKCDDGYYAEGTADLTVVLLAEWKDFHGLVGTSSKSEPFLNYVLRNINSTADKKNLESILANTKNKCPTLNRKMCERISQSASEAIKEIGNE